MQKTNAAKEIAVESLTKAYQATLPVMTLKFCALVLWRALLAAALFAALMTPKLERSATKIKPAMAPTRVIAPQFGVMSAANKAAASSARHRTSAQNFRVITGNVAWYALVSDSTAISLAALVFCMILNP